MASGEGAGSRSVVWLNGALTSPPLLSSSFSSKDAFRISRICLALVSSSPNLIGMAVYFAAAVVAILQLATLKKCAVHLLGSTRGTTALTHERPQRASVSKRVALVLLPAESGSRGGVVDLLGPWAVDMSRRSEPPRPLRARCGSAAGVWTPSWRARQVCKGLQSLS